jgi:hypothetical protein
MKIADHSMQVTKALPAAGASANTDSVDLKCGDQVGPIGYDFEVHVTLPDLDSLADDKDCTITFEDSADDSSFSAITAAPTFTLTGAGGAGATGDTWRFVLPPETRRYFRAVATVEAAGGDNTSESLTVDFRVAS